MQVNATAATGFNTPPQAASPASSRGSWVVDPEDGGWDGVGVSPPHSPAPAQRQHRLSPAASPLRSWAQVPQSPPAAQYPTSPPRSPGSVRSSCSGSGSAAGEGLVGLARDEISDEMEVCEEPVAYPSAPVPCPSVPSPSRAPSQGKEAVGCTEIGDVDMVDVKLSDGVEFPVVVSAGLTPAEAAEAIAEAGELGAAGEPTLNPTSLVVASPSRTSTAALAREPSLPVRSASVAARAGTPPRIASPPRTRAPVSVTTGVSAVPGVSCRWWSCCAQGPRACVRLRWARTGSMGLRCTGPVLSTCRLCIAAVTGDVRRVGVFLWSCGALCVSSLWPGSLLAGCSC